MASIYREFDVQVSAAVAWDCIRDVGKVHERLAQGFVTDTVLEGDSRTVSFANGFVVQERIVAIDDVHRRLAYTSVGGRASHHNASFQVFEQAPGARIVWITDLLPEDVQGPIAQMVDHGIEAIRRTLAAGRAQAN